MGEMRYKLLARWPGTEEVMTAFISTGLEAYQYKIAMEKYGWNVEIVLIKEVRISE